jgi:branched-subunit amino acid transport protein
MSWTFVLVLSGTAYAFKFLGLVVIGGRSLPPAIDRCLALIPSALIAAITVDNTFGNGQSLQVDARAAGVGVAVLAAWRRLPLIVVIVLGAAATAAVRALT